MAGVIPTGEENENRNPRSGNSTATVSCKPRNPAAGASRANVRTRPNNPPAAMQTPTHKPALTAAAAAVKEWGEFSLY